LLIQALVVVFTVVMCHEVLNGRPQRTLSKQDQPFQAGFLDASHKSLGVGVGMSLQMRRMATLKVDVSE